MSKKNFTTPLLITGTPQEPLALVPKLEALGYEWSASRKDDYNLYPVLHTAYRDWGNAGHLGFSLDEWHKPGDVTKVPASNEALVLALASQTEGQELSPGEYIIKGCQANVCIEESWGTFFQCEKLEKSNMYGSHVKLYAKRKDGELDWFDHAYYRDGQYRKATAQEIIEYFKIKANPLVQQPERYEVRDGVEERSITIDLSPFANVINRVLKQSMKITTEPAVLKYKLKKQYPGSRKIDTIFHYNEHNYDFICKDGITNDGQTRFFSVSVKDISNTEFFEPIIEDVVEHIKLRSQQGEFEIEVSKKGIYYKRDDAYLSPNGLREIIGDLDVQLGRMNAPGTYKFSVTHIDSGCKKQVPVEDWMKVLNAYDRLSK